MYNLRAKRSERREEMKTKYLRREEILEGQEEQKEPFMTTLQELR